MKSIFKCPKCGNSTLSTSTCEDGIVVVSCEYEYSDKTECGFYSEMIPFDVGKIVKEIIFDVNDE